MRSAPGVMGSGTGSRFPRTHSTQPRADDGIRTRDPHLGKVMRYQLRYVRIRRNGVWLILSDVRAGLRGAADQPVDLK